MNTQDWHDFYSKQQFPIIVYGTRTNNENDLVVEKVRILEYSLAGEGCLQKTLLSKPVEGLYPSRCSVDFFHMTKEDAEKEIFQTKYGHYRKLTKEQIRNIHLQSYEGEVILINTDWNSIGYSKVEDLYIFCAEEKFSEEELNQLQYFGEKSDE